MQEEHPAAGVAQRQAFAPDPSLAQRDAVHELVGRRLGDGVALEEGAHCGERLRQRQGGDARALRWRQKQGRPLVEESAQRLAVLGSRILDGRGLGRLRSL